MCWTLTTFYLPSLSIPLSVRFKTLTFSLPFPPVPVICNILLVGISKISELPRFIVVTLLFIVIFREGLPFLVKFSAPGRVLSSCFVLVSGCCTYSIKIRPLCRSKFVVRSSSGFVASERYKNKLLFYTKTYTIGKPKLVIILCSKALQISRLLNSIATSTIE